MRVEAVLGRGGSNQFFYTNTTTPSFRTCEKDKETFMERRQRTQLPLISVALTRLPIESALSVNHTTTSTKRQHRDNNTPKTYKQTKTQQTYKFVLQRGQPRSSSGCTGSDRRQRAAWAACVVRLWRQQQRSRRRCCILHTQPRYETEK